VQNMAKKQSRNSRKSTKSHRPSKSEKDPSPQPSQPQPQPSQPQPLSFSSMLKAKLKEEEHAAKVEEEEKKKMLLVNRTSLKLNPGWSVMYYDIETHKIKSEHIPSKMYPKEPMPVLPATSRLVPSPHYNELTTEPVINDNAVLEALVKLHERRMERYDSKRYEGAFRELYPIYDAGFPEEEDADDYYSSEYYSSDEYYSDNDSINSFGRHREYDW
jgi:hypothetical protein